MIEHGPLIERLLAGDFICEINDSDAHRRLSDDQLQQKLNH